ncbi:MAG: extracellular solute-binding protein [Anderseniella sp.]|nr:extracellular solute-binding protein [Anderseniella sp.]
MIDRRTLLQLTAATGVLHVLPPGAARAAEPQWRHGLSLFGNLKYPEGFEHFDYVNTDAPKGGRARVFSLGSFDSLNPFTFKGSAAGIVGQTFDTLMDAALDEAGSEYALIAEAVKKPDDFSWVTYRINSQARFHDGTPITPEDVIWSLEALKGAHPFYNSYYANVSATEQTAGNEVTFRFNQSGNRELPQIVGQIPVLSKAWWTGKNDKGETRDINSTTLEAPLGNGAYRIAEVKPGTSITLERVKDYWAADLPVNRGKNNFDEIFVIYYRDNTIAMEGFKGDEYDFRAESSSKDWATSYDFPAAKRGDVLKEEIYLKNPDGMQAYVFNTRRERFADAKVRQALNFAFDFEWANQNLFFGQYVRTASYFANSELAWSGLPEGKELDILNEVKDQVPAEVFTAQYTNPSYATPQDKRNNLRTAAKLLSEAGWSVGNDRMLRNGAGQAFEIEFLLVSPLFERVVLPYVSQLELLGIKSTVRTIDSAQYERRVQAFDYDCIVGSWGQSLSPGNEQRNFWGSEAADREGSRNFVGIKNPAVDKLIDRIIFAKDREELVAACRALDRVLLWNHYVVPMWNIPYERIAFWNRFGRPEKLPDHSLGFPAIWWWDEAKAAKVKA